MTEQHERVWIGQIKWCIENEHDFYRCGTGSAVCENCGLTKRESAEMEALLNEYETLKKATERLKVIFDSIDDYLAPVTAKSTTKDEYVPVEASTLAWWMDAIEEILEGK